MFLKPLSGFSRLGSGFIAPGWGLMPTWAALTTRAAITHTSITGAAARPAARAWPESSGPRPRWSTTPGEETSANVSRRQFSSVWTRCGAVALSANSAANSTIAPLRSALFATWPFLRASDRRFGVAFSVLSPAAMSGDPQGLERGGDAALELVGDPAGGERQRDADDEQADRDLGREADGEDVELRHDAGHDAERDVGDHHREHDRRGQLDGGDEDAGERVLDARDHRADRRVVDERHELVGAVQALDDPRVAADGDEDRDADERVELRQHRRVHAGDRVDERAEREADERVRERAGGGHGVEEDGDRQAEGEADEQLLCRQPAERDDVERDVAALQGHRPQAARQADGGDAAHARGDHLRVEHRRDEEQRRDAREHEHEARDLLLGELGQQRAHGPTICGIEEYSACV